MRHTPFRRGALPPALALFVLSVLAGCGGGKPSTAPQLVETAPAPVTGAPQAEAPAAITAPPAPPARVPALPGTVGIMVENSAGSRPQSGLDKADVVYEMESEYGVTRFLALYYTTPADKVGPVRSARMGFYDVAVGYGLPYAHAGGNNDVLVELKQRPRTLLNLDEIYTCGACFWRTRDREPPHNLYTSTELLVDHTRAVGFSLKPLLRLPEGDLSGGKPAAAVAFHWGVSTSERVTWTWNGRRYQRSQSGGPHVMDSGANVETDNLAVLFTTYRWDQSAQWGEGQNNISIVGQGSGYLFRGGQVYPIRWQKPDRAKHYQFTTPDGEPVRFAPGQTWFEVLKSSEHVTQGLPE